MKCKILEKGAIKACEDLYKHLYSQKAIGQISYAIKVYVIKKSPFCNEQFEKE